ncbi:MAG: TRL-like family protein [Pseudomonadota bacterium]
MNRSIVAVLGLLLLMTTTGCLAMSTRAPLIGLGIQNVKAGELVTEHQNATKMGEACASSILGAVAQGDASIRAAAEKGGITKIAYVDSRSTNVFGIYAKYCTIVWGE